MRTTTAFAARTFRFVVWTFSSPSAWPLGCLPSSLYTFSSTVADTEAWLGITSPPASPTLTGVHVQVSLRAAHGKILICVRRTLVNRPFAAPRILRNW